MGNLVSKRIEQTRLWLTGDVQPIPDYDYEYIYPVTVYEAVKRTMEANSPTLDDEIESIYRLISEKQAIIEAGVAGRLMMFTGIRGRVGNMQVVKKIAPETINQSNAKVPTERAVGDALAQKVSIQSFRAHSGDGDIHTTKEEKARWNSMAPASILEQHTSNGDLHVTPEEKDSWNGKADGELLEGHVYNTKNPHNVTAHQTGTYNRNEIDKMFEDLRESFFHYMNILWDERMNRATLEDYDEVNWNPNYVLEYGESLPDPEDPTGTYFALIPASDYSTNESNDCIIYVKLPGLTWQEVGLQSMNPGDMVIQYPGAKMYVWVQGHFTNLFKSEGSASGGDEPGTVPVSNLLWKPVMTESGELGWELTSSKDPPGTMVIKGYTPIKGIDYKDGRDGQGVPVGGRTHDILAKVSEDDNDTEWKDFHQVLLDFRDDGGVLPDGIVPWDCVVGHPKSYDSLGTNTDGFVIQKVVTENINDLSDRIKEIKELLDAVGDLTTVAKNIRSHLSDYNNPHKVTAGQIGAVATKTFVEHAQNFDNPHVVTAEQLGLGRVNNTPDEDKPISKQMQAALDDLEKKIKALANPGEVTDPELVRYVDDVEWNETDRIITVFWNDNTTLDIPIPETGNVTQVFTQMHFNHETKEIVIVNPNTGEEDAISIIEMIQHFVGSDGTHIKIEIDDDDVVHATLKPGSISGTELASSIHLNGNPTARTQDIGDKSTRLATTEWVRSQVIDNLISYEVDRPLSANMGRILNERKADIEDILVLIEGLEGIDIIDNLDSTSVVAALSANMGRYLDVTKAPRVHTSPSGSTFGRATKDLFGHVRGPETDPLMDGTVSIGTDNGRYSNADHRHPTDDTRAPMHWPDVIHGQYAFTGEPRAPLAPDDSNDNRLATTEWVRRNAVGVSWGLCTTDGASSVKIATLRSDFMADPVFLRQTGSTVVIHFSATDVSESATMLDVHGTGPAPVLYEGKPVANNMIDVNHDHIFTFDGTNWCLLNPAALFELPPDEYSNRIVTAEWVNKNMNGVVACTCTTGGAYSNKVAVPITAGTTAPPFILKPGAAVSVTFNEKDVSTTAYPTKLNVAGTGPRTIIFANAPLLDGLIGKGYTHFFVYDGTYWMLINPANTSNVWDEGGIVIGPGGRDPDPVTPGGDDPTDPDDPTTPVDPSDPSGPDDPGTKPVDHTVVNLMSGYLGYTHQGDGATDGNGYVDRVWFMITFTPQQYDLECTISNQPNAFGARMGNGNTIILKNPTVISLSRQSCVIQFTMNTRYPMNSPCHLMYRTNAAWINIKKKAEAET